MGKENSAAGSSAAAAPAPQRSLEAGVNPNDAPDQFCSTLAKRFGVRPTEVALLRLEKGLLKFLFPDELKTAGAIPVSSSSAVAAHTAATRKVELFNAFAKVKHASIFETVKLGKRDDSDRSEQASIQKLMSAPVLSSDRKVLGVLQICRKGFDTATAGPDFTLDDLQLLEVAARLAATMQFLK